MDLTVTCDLLILQMHVSGLLPHAVVDLCS